MRIVLADPSRAVHRAMTQLIAEGGHEVIAFADGREALARIAEDDFLSLHAPVIRVGGYDIPYPPAKVEDLYLPDLDRVLDAVDAVLNY